MSCGCVTVRTYRALIGHYGKEKIDLDFLPLATGSATATTLGVDKRPWLVDLGDINGAGIGLAAVGGLLGFIVMFFDQNITVRLVNAREHKLKKGYGYDMDMLALSLCSFLLSLCGCPWMVSASKCAVPLPCNRAAMQYSSSNSTVLRD
jgi:hypothetical protein